MGFSEVSLKSMFQTIMSYTVLLGNFIKALQLTAPWSGLSKFLLHDSASLGGCFVLLSALKCHIYLTYIQNTGSFPGQQWLNMWQPSLSRANEQSQLLSGPETVNRWSLIYRSACQCVDKPCWSHPTVLLFTRKCLHCGIPIFYF